MSKKTEALDFEKALKELEVLVEKMEDGELTLEAALETYERGVALGHVCQKALDGAEARIRILTEKGQDATLEPFEAPDAEDEA